MKNLIKGKEGITLIALVITIIILLILAGVAVATLTGDNGILTKTTSSKEENIKGEENEKIRIGYNEYQIKKYTDTNPQLTVDGASSVTGDETNGWAISFASGRTYQLSAGGTITEQTNSNVEEWIDNGNGTFSKGNLTVEVGDSVNYDPTKDVNGNTLTTTYTSYARANASADKNEGRTSGYTVNQEFSVSATTNGWRVLGINESGQIELISADPIQTSSSKLYYIGGAEGYLEGPEELNAICSIFGQGRGAVSARSLNIDDIDKLAGITTETDKKACTNSYGNKWQYRYPTTEEVSGSRYMQCRTDKGTGYGNWTNITSNISQIFKMPEDTDFFGKISDTNIVAGYSPELKYTGYYYNIASKVTKTTKDGTSIADILSNGSTSSNKNQWLASNHIVCNQEYASFRLRCIKYGGISEAILHDSYTKSGIGIDSMLVRPVVTLQSNVQLTGSSSEGWTI